MEIFKFNVEFVTPLLIGGATNNSLYPEGLSGKALRGCWRFWCRALIGGMVKDVAPGGLKQLENDIFGSADDKIGAKFRLIVEGHNSNKSERFSLGFKRKNHNGKFEEVKKKDFLKAHPIQ